VPARDNAPLEREPPPLTVTIDLQPVAYKELDPVQRAAWDSFWGELIRSVSLELCHPQLTPTGDIRNQHCTNSAADIEDDQNDNRKVHLSSSSAG
jgi:hypothetical protein